MNTVEIDCLIDPRLDRYRELKAARRSRNDTYFIGEGRWVVERMLESDFEVESLLVAKRRLSEFAPFVRGDIPVFVVEQSLCEQLVGFKFHSGVLGCGRRRKESTVTSRLLQTDAPSLWCAVPHVTLDVNLGAMIRSCAALGATGALVGQTSADPFSRQTIRSSMGNVFFVPVIQPDEFLLELKKLRDDHGFDLIAMTQRNDSQSLHRFSFSKKTVLVFGNEAEGLSEEYCDECRVAVEIPMVDRIDSLNIAASAAIGMFEWNRQMAFR